MRRQSVSKGGATRSSEASARKLGQGLGLGGMQRFFDSMAFFPPPSSVEGKSRPKLLPSDGASSSSDEGDSDDGSACDLSARQRLALTLKNWSLDVENGEMVRREGGIGKICQLAFSAAADDWRTRRYCAEALRHLSANPRNREELKDKGAVSAIVQLLSTKSRKKPLCRKLLSALASSILNLTLQTSDGSAAGLVAGGADLAIWSLLQQLRRGRAHVSPPSMLCAKALYNLTCGCTEAYPGMDKIANTLVGIAQDPLALPEHSSLMVSAVCNCSALPSLHGRVLEMGSLHALSNVFQMAREDRRALASPADFLATHAAIALCNLAASPSCRFDMALQNVVALLQRLARVAASPQALFYVGATLRRLTASREAALLKLIRQTQKQALDALQATQEAVAASMRAMLGQMKEADLETAALEEEGRRLQAASAQGGC